jgi:peptidoglycan/xylan/chitin deacetylase (PgdA/CDA1 family)
MIWKATVALHVGAVAATAVNPHLWPWSLGAVVANHGAITFAGLWPRSSLLGPNWTRLPPAVVARKAVAITIDDGPDSATTFRVLDLLDAAGAKATFFCIGRKIESFRALTREIVDRGHAIENHSYRHTNYFSLLGPRRMAAELARAQDVIAEVTGTTPRFFRAPAGLRNPFLNPLLQKYDLRLASWTRRGFDTVNGNADVVFRRVTRNLASGDILLLHDGNAAKTASGAPVIYEVLPRMLRELATHGLQPIVMRDALAS